MTEDIMLALATVSGALTLLTIWLIPKSWERPFLVDDLDPKSDLAMRARRVHIGCTVQYAMVCVLVAAQFCQALYILASGPGNGLDTDQYRWFSWVLDLVALFPIGTTMTLRLDAKEVASALDQLANQKRTTLIEISDVITLAAKSGGWAGRPPEPMYDEQDRPLYH